MPRPSSYAVFCLKKKNSRRSRCRRPPRCSATRPSQPGGPAACPAAGCVAVSARPSAGPRTGARSPPRAPLLFHATATTEIYTLSLHDALPICIKDECSRLLEASTMKSRRGFAIQRLMNAMRQAHADGWFIVFDTLTLADDRLEAFYDNPNALRDYFRDIGRMVLAAE